MKRILLTILAALCAPVFFAGCTRAQRAADTEGLRITASFYPLYIMLLNITDGVEGVGLSLLVPASGGDLHDYQLTTNNMKDVEGSDVLVFNGAGMESFMDKIAADKADSLIIASEGFPLIDGNPHVWVSPSGAAYQTRKIAAGLAALDPAHAERYLANGEAYAQSLESLASDMQRELAFAAGSSIITFHEAFPYFAAECGLTVRGVIEKEPGTAPSPRELSDIISMVNEARDAGLRPPALFAEVDYSSSAAEIIERETGSKVYELDPYERGPLEKDAYIQAARKNLAELKAALSDPA